MAKHLVVRQHLVACIAEGLWQPGVAIPSEKDLCEGIGVSRTTVRKAIGDLVHEGRLFTVQGKGTFVAPAKVEQRFIQRAFGIYEDLEGQRVSLVTRVLRQDVVPAPGEVARRLEVSAGTQTHLIVRLRSVGNEPLLVSTTYIPFALCPELETEDLESGSLYALLRDRYALTINHGERRIEAVPAGSREARLLDVALAAPLLLLESVAYTARDVPFEHSVALQRADRTKFEFTFGPSPDERAVELRWADNDSSAADLIGAALAMAQ